MNLFMKHAQSTAQKPPGQPSHLSDIVSLHVPTNEEKDTRISIQHLLSTQSRI